MDIIGIMTGHTLETTTIREAETTTPIILETIRTTTSHTTKTKAGENLTIRKNTTATVLWNRLLKSMTENPSTFPKVELEIMIVLYAKSI